MEFVLIIDTARPARPAHSRAVHAALARQKLLLLFRRRYSRARLRANFQVGGRAGDGGGGGGGGAGSDSSDSTDGSTGTDSSDDTDSSDGTDDQALIFHLPGRRLKIPHTDFFELHPPPELNDLTNDESAALLTALQNSICQTQEEELAVVLDMLTGHGMLNVRNGDVGVTADVGANAVADGNAEAGLKYIKMLPPILRKLAHKKNKERFYHFLSRVKELEKLQPALYQSIKDKIKTTEELAEKRFEN